jgi:proline dehydrogenase
MDEVETGRSLDLYNTEIAFSHLSNNALVKTARLFKLMGNPTFVNLGTKLGLLAVKMRFPLTETIIRKTIFNQFCGGENLLGCQKTIDYLYKQDTLTILDYGAEAKSSEEDLDKVMRELTRAVEFAASNNSVPVVSTKLSGLADNELLTKVQDNQALNASEQRAFRKLHERVNHICARAHELGVGIMIDAEESWLQDTLDDLVDEMMAKYNKQRVVVYNTFQLYRHDRLAFIHESYEKARKEGYLLGAKLVRGAYMEKERERAKEMGYPSPIQVDKEATDKDYNEAIRFCVEHYDTLASCNACHNIKSNEIQAELILSKNIQRNHPHLNFCQLYGMSDYITFNLADHGFNVAKYLPYGPIREVMPYLIRRAQENTAIRGEMSRELEFLEREIERRKL